MKSSSQQQQTSPPLMKSIDSTSTTDQSTRPNSVSEEVDEWIFSVRLPRAVASHGNTPSKKWQLRRTQPRKAPKLYRKYSATSLKNLHRRDDNNNDNNDPDYEDVALLERNESNAVPGWTLTSPFWSLTSQILLTVTYFPAWQAIPEYTNATARSKLSGCSPCRKHTGTEYTGTVYTAADVAHVQLVPDYSVQGIGSCQAMRLFLKPLPIPSNWPPVPAYLQSAWQEHVQRMQHSRQTRTMPHHGQADDSDVHLEGPVLTICLPNSHIDPPLLYSVQFPALSVPIAIETFTVLNGQLTYGDSSSGSTSATSTRPNPDNKEDTRPTHIYINGYQSWSFAGSIPRGHPQPRSGLPDMFSRAFNFGGSPPPVADIIHCRSDDSTAAAATTTTNISNNHEDYQAMVDKSTLDPFVQHYQSDFFTCITSDGTVPARRRLSRALQKRRRKRGITTGSDPTLSLYQQLDETGGPALVLGWLAQRRQFGVVTSNAELTRFQMHCSCHGQILLPKNNQTDTTFEGIRTDWAYMQLISPHSYDEEPMVHYLHAVAAHNQARPLQNGSLLTGWCSWYFAYEKISALLLQANSLVLHELKSTVPTNVVVVDDGYMTAWGDWDSLKPREFPSGLKVVADDIGSRGMRPGVWLAPFSADKHSKVAKEHSDWIIRNDAGAPANSSNCGKFFYGLDVTHPEVRAHVQESIRRAVVDWGFSVLKIDFLYSACLEGNGKYDLSMSRAEAMDLGLQIIRETAGPNVFLIGCGCPIATAIGYVDAMRVSADTGPTWYPPMPLPWWDQGTIPSLRGMIRNSISRAPMGHRWWHNDPDCLMFGEHTRLTNDEVASAASIVAMTCGMLLLSDDLPNVPMERMNLLTKIFPMTGASAVVLDLHSTNHNGLPSLMRLWCTDKYKIWDEVQKECAISNKNNETENENLPVVAEEDVQEPSSSSPALTSSIQTVDYNARATVLARRASFQLNAELSDPEERERSCIHVTKGLGTWTVVSISNWQDRADVVQIPPPALLPPPKHGWKKKATPVDGAILVTSDDDDGDDDDDDDAEPDIFGDKDGKKKETAVHGRHGYHVFAFWSSRYSWLPRIPREEDLVDDSISSESGKSLYPQQTISIKLAPHGTEIFHIKPVSPDEPQYIGSDIHFSCGQELILFKTETNSLKLWLNPAHKRQGSIFVFVPRTSTNNIRVTIGGESSTKWSTIGNTPSIMENGSPRLAGKIISIQVAVRGDGTPLDGQIKLDF